MWLEQMTFEGGQSTRPIPYGYLSPVIDAARRDAARQSVPVTAEEVAEGARAFVYGKHPEWHDHGVGIVQGSHYRSGFQDGAKWTATAFLVTRKPTETEEEG